MENNNNNINTIHSKEWVTLNKLYTCSFEHLDLDLVVVFFYFFLGSAKVTSADYYIMFISDIHIGIVQ